MSEQDFVLKGGIDDRAIIETLKGVVAQAAKAGADAGKALDKGLSDAAKRSGVGANLLKEIEASAARFPNAISSQLTRAVSSASTPATQLGTLVAKGVKGGADQIPTIIGQALSSATSKAGQAGQQIGTAVGTGAQGPLSRLLGTSISTSLASAAGAAQRGGQQIGAGVAGGAGTSLERLLPSAMTRAFRTAPAVGATAGRGLATSLTQATQAGLGTSNVFRPLAQQGTETARILAQEYTRTGQQLLTAGNGLKYWVDQQGQARTVTGQYVSALERQKAGLSGLDAQTKASVKSAGLLQGGLQSLTSELMSFVGTVGIGTVALRAFGEVKAFDSARAAIQTLGADTTNLSAELRALSLELNSNVSQVQLAQAAYDVISSGFTTTAQAADILRAASLGATGGFAELGDVAKALTGIINAYGLSTKDAQTIVDGFVQTQNDGVITVRQYAAEIGNVSSIAAAAGISIQELNAAVATATLKGVPVQQTFTGIRQAISNILKPSAEASRLASQLGVDFSVSALKSKGLAGVLADVQRATGGAADKIAILLGSVEAQAAIQPLLNDNLVTYNRLLDQQGKAAGSAAKAAQIAGNTVEGAIKRVGVALSNLAASFATGGLGSSVTNQLNEYVGAINNVSGAIAALSQLLSNIPALPDLGKLADGANVVLNPIMAIVKALNNPALQGFINLFVKPKQDAKELGDNVSKVAPAVEATTTAQNKQNTALGVAVAASSQVLDLQQKINQTIGEAPLRNLDQQLQVGNALLNLSKAAADLEASRFSLASTVLSAQLEEAQQRGASEATISQIKARQAEVEAQSARARLDGLVRAQALEVQILDLTQRRQVLEANLAINEARVDLGRKELELQQALLLSDQERIQQATAERDLAAGNLGIRLQSLGLIQQIQPIEKAIAEAGREKARNEATAAAYTATFKANLADAVKPGGELASTAGRTAVKFSELGVGTQELVKGLSSSNGILGELSRRMLSVSQGSSIAAASAKQIGLYGRGSVGSYAGIGSSLDQAGISAEAFAGSGIDAATAAAASGAAVLNRNMNQAVSGARAFYDALAAASGLPGARWAGGGVEAGGKYRINDGPGLRSLGTESFLSRSGRLSLINRPANSLWTAPSDGVVIPAATTAKLQAQGILPGGSGSRRGARPVAPGGRADASQSRLEAAITTLTAAVTYLAGKDWSVRVPDTSGARRRQLLHMISSLS